MIAAAALSLLLIRTPSGATEFVGGRTTLTNAAVSPELALMRYRSSSK
jgi:hypothetical protein